MKHMKRLLLTILITIGAVYFIGVTLNATGSFVTTNPCNGGLNFLKPDYCRYDPNETFGEWESRLSQYDKLEFKPLNTVNAVVIPIIGIIYGVLIYLLYHDRSKQRDKLKHTDSSDSSQK